MKFEIRKYSKEFADAWNEFVANSRNSSFLFNRNYMDYHADRFSDCSWMAFKGNRLIALLPANITSDGTLHSHGGLTYGGWILPKSHFNGADLLEIFQEAMRVWSDNGISTLDYKPLPYIYSTQPSQEDEYALFRLGATISESNLSAAIDLRRPIAFNQQQRRHLAKALKLPIEVRETDDINAFMCMLTDCLRLRHDTTPVHSAEEMRLLANRFPKNIRFFATYLDGVPHAAVCIYDTKQVAHAQYIATTDEGRQFNLLTPLFHKLITDTFASRAYFDFGISNENHGLYLNEGLLQQKYSYGATGVVYSRYSLRLK